MSLDARSFDFDDQYDLVGMKIRPHWKKQKLYPSNEIKNKNTIVTTDDELKYLISSSDYEQIKNRFKPKVKSSHIRPMINAPVMILYLVNIILEKDENDQKYDKPLAPHGPNPTLLYTIHFPSKSNMKELQGIAIHSMDEEKTYTANSIWRHSSDEEFDEDEDE